MHFQEEIDNNTKRIKALEKNPTSASAISGGDRRRHLESVEGVSRSSAPTLTSHDSSRQQEFSHLPPTSTAEILVIFKEERDKQERASNLVLHNLPESTNASHLDEVLKIFPHLSASTEIARLGRVTSPPASGISKPRPLLIKTTRTHKTEAFRAKNRLPWKNHFFNHHFEPRPDP